MTTTIEVKLESRISISVQTDIYVSTDHIKEIEELIVKQIKDFQSDK